ncbi:MAG: sigma-54-dependent Fis family transcriptional regulator [Desulfobacteraceae bacterium]|nr:MAG: sigma-54-dependent Fis family transcriptional regulator [Desulfobacteraceae bacterium]
MASRILVVDDEESIRFTFSTFLSREGYEVLTAPSYPAGLEMLSAGEIDLVFADIILGGHEGTEILKEVKQREMRCPVIMITGQPNVDSAAESVRQGAFDYLPKPVQKETLLRAAKMALSHKRLIEEKERVEREREQYRKNLKAIFRSIKDAIITVDNDMRVIEANEATAEICGVRPEEIIGKPYGEGMVQCRISCLPDIEDIIGRRAEIIEQRIQCTYRRKPDRVVVLNGSPLLGSDDNVSGAVLTIRDVTRLNELERELKERYHFQNIIGKSTRMQEIFRLIEDLGQTDTTVLISGESGTGKEVVAKALHHSGPRSRKPLVSVNCSALAETLLESELFGHVKGAFTGAVAAKKGRFQVADGGTIFLDEIGEISPLIQLKLLRVLQEKEFERVGDSTTLKADVRVIAATNKDLRESVKEGSFREDLFYRLKVVEIVVPPLRERVEDIPLLIDHFRTRFNKVFDKNILGIHSDVLELFMRYPWPGNVRELEHAVEHAFVLCHEETILSRHIPAEIVKWSAWKNENVKREPAGDVEAISIALRKSGWNKARAARILGVSRQTLYRKLKEYHIALPDAFESHGTEM